MSFRELFFLFFRASETPFLMVSSRFSLSQGFRIVSVSVYTWNSVEVKASSSASVSFSGNPRNVSKEMSSPGSIMKR